MTTADSDRADLPQSVMGMARVLLGLKRNPVRFLLASALAIVVAVLPIAIRPHAPVTPFPDPPTAAAIVQITSLSDGKFVDLYEQVRGHVSNANTKVWLLVQTPAASCWLQGPAIIEATGDFSIAAQFGDGGSGGVQFAVRAVVNPPAGIKAGLVSCGMQADAFSRMVLVTRR